MKKERCMGSRGRLNTTKWMVALVPLALGLVFGTTNLLAQPQLRSVMQEASARSTPIGQDSQSNSSDVQASDDSALFPEGFGLTEFGSVDSSVTPSSTYSYPCIYNEFNQINNIRTVCPILSEPSFPWNRRPSYPIEGTYVNFGCPIPLPAHGQLFNAYHCVTTDFQPLPPNIYTCADICPSDSFIDGVYLGFHLLTTVGSGALCPLSDIKHICAPGSQEQPWLIATPAKVVIPIGQSSASATVLWNMKGWLPGGTVKVSVNGAPETPWTSGGMNSETRVWPYITAGSTTVFKLYRTGSTNFPVATATVIGTRELDPPTLTATPNPVQVPFGQSQGLYSIAWSAPGYANVDIWLKVNSSAPTLWGPNAPTTGSTPAIHGISLGDTYTITMYPAGTQSPLLKSLTVTSVAAPSPTLVATPNPVVVPAGQSQGLYSIAWSAPGYANVDIWLKVNSSAPTLWGPNAPTTGSTPAIHGISLGDTYTITMYPAGALAPILKTLTVTSIPQP
jgi:hypothetical protein